MNIEKSNIANLPTKYGKFKIRAYKQNNQEHLAIMSENFNEIEIPYVRIHSECLTGDTLGSLKCDCQNQLDLSLKFIAQEGGLVIYHRQEGRNIGLLNKVNAYALQDQGRNTIEANLELGFGEDDRDYSVVEEIFKDLDLKNIKLITNNPKKIDYVESIGVKIVDRIPAITKLNKFNEHYVNTKKEKMGHLFLMFEKNQLVEFNLDDEFIKGVKPLPPFLKQWGKVHNLSGSLDDESIKENIIDSIYPLSFIDSFDSFADIGTGAGYPGLILAMANSKAKCYLIEPRLKRVAFLNFVKNTLKLKNVEVIAKRVEEVEGVSVDLITSRAVTNTKLLMNITKTIKKENSSFLFYKGSLLNDELEEAKINNQKIVKRKDRNYLYIKR